MYVPNRPPISRQQSPLFRKLSIPKCEYILKWGPYSLVRKYLGAEQKLVLCRFLTDFPWCQPKRSGLLGKTSELPLLWGWTGWWWWASVGSRSARCCCPCWHNVILRDRIVYKKLFTDILLLSVSFRKNTDNVHWFTSQLTDMQEWSISDVSSLMNWERSGVILPTKSKYYIL